MNLIHIQQSPVKARAVLVEMTGEMPWEARLSRRLTELDALLCHLQVHSAERVSEEP